MDLDYDLVNELGVKYDYNIINSKQINNMNQEKTYIPKVYPINECKAPIINLIQDIYSSSKYKQLLLEMEVLKKNGKRDVEQINNIINNLIPYGTTEETLFIAKDIFIIIGRKIDNTTFNHYKEYEIVWAKIPNSNKIIPMLTWKGIIRAGFDARNARGELMCIFAYNCIELVLKMKDKSKEILSKINSENPELIDKINEEFKLDMLRYKELLEYEKSKKLLLKDELDKSELEKIQISIDNNNNKCKIEDIKELLKFKKDELELYRNKLENIQDEKLLNNNYKELEILRRMFCKPLYIYVLSPNIFTNKKKNINDDNLNQIDNSQDYIKYMDLVLDLYTEEKYRLYKKAYEIYKNKLPNKIIDYLKSFEDNENNIKNFSEKNKSIIKDCYLVPVNKSDKLLYINPMKYAFDENELVYIYLHFGKEIDNPNLYYICTEWVINELHYNNIITKLKESFIQYYNIKLNKTIKTFWRTSISDIRNIIQIELLNKYENANLDDDSNENNYSTKSEWTKLLNNK
jgi:hypothetical protein